MPVPANLMSVGFEDTKEDIQHTQYTYSFFLASAELLNLYLPHCVELLQ